MDFRELVELQEVEYVVSISESASFVLANLLYIVRPGCDHKNLEHKPFSMDDQSDV